MWFGLVWAVCGGFQFQVVVYSADVKKHERVGVDARLSVTGMPATETSRPHEAKACVTCGVTPCHGIITTCLFLSLSLVDEFVGS